MIAYREANKRTVEHEDKRKGKVKLKCPETLTELFMYLM